MASYFLGFFRFAAAFKRASVNFRAAAFSTAGGLGRSPPSRGRWFISFLRARPLRGAPLHLGRAFLRRELRPIGLHGM
jgi:hypothetical protein